MPPRAIASRVRPAIASAPGRPAAGSPVTAVRACRRSKNSSTIDGGNFGAPPNPPRAESNSLARPSTAASLAAISPALAALCAGPPAAADRSSSGSPIASSPASRRARTPAPARSDKATEIFFACPTTLSRSLAQASAMPRISRWNTSRGK